MKKLLVATEKPFAKAAVDGIRGITEKANYELVLLEKYLSKDDLLKAVADVDAIIIRSDKINKEVMDSAKNLKIVVRAGAGYDNVELGAASEKGIVVMNTPGQNSNAVAELAFGMMTYHARGFFNGKAGTELKDKTLGIHAYGAVGRHVARIAKGFGMTVYAFDPFVSKENIEKDGVKAIDSVDELYKMSQYISLHIPANENTKNSINFDLLNKMPKGATLVNTARKEVICEESLKKIFKAREDFNYLTDIGPTAEVNNELIMAYPTRFYTTPKKMGAQTQEANVNSGLAAANQIVNFLEKGDETFKVNK